MQPSAAAVEDVTSLALVRSHARLVEDNEGPEPEPRVHARARPALCKYFSNEQS